MINTTWKFLISGVLVAGLAACAGDDTKRKPPPEDQIVGQTGEGTSLQRFDIRHQGRLLRVLVFDRGGSARTITVTATSYRGVDQADGQVALNAAVKAGLEIDCDGQPMRVLGNTGQFQEQGRRSAFTQGEAAWVFQGQCG